MDNKSKAIWLMVLSSLSFALMGAVVKFAGDLPLFMRIFSRDFVVVMFAVLMLSTQKTSPFGNPGNRAHLLIRGISGFIGVIFFFYSTTYLHLSDSTILNKLSPFFTTLFCVLLLREKLPKIQIPALILSLLGALLVIKPQFSLSLLPALSGLMGAIIAGFSYTMVISLSGKEHPLVVVFYFSCTSALCSFFIMLFDLQMPTNMQFVYLFLIGLFATGGQVFLTYSYKYAKASDISIYSYATIVFAGVIGYFIWKEIPDVYSWIGTLLIVFASTLVYISNHHKRKKSEG